MKLAIESMSNDKNLWQCYFKDFIALKLKLASPDGASQQNDIAYRILHIYFNELDDKEMPQKLVELHCHASIEHLSLAHMATNLRPLNKIERVLNN